MSIIYNSYAKTLFLTFFLTTLSPVIASEKDSSSINSLELLIKSLENEQSFFDNKVKKNHRYSLPQEDREKCRAIRADIIKNGGSSENGRKAYVHAYTTAQHRLFGCHLYGKSLKVEKKPRLKEIAPIKIKVVKTKPAKVALIKIKEYLKNDGAFGDVTNIVTVRSALKLSIEDREKCKAIKSDILKNGGSLQEATKAYSSAFTKAHYRTYGRHPYDNQKKSISQDAIPVPTQDE